MFRKPRTLISVVTLSLVFILLMMPFFSMQSKAADLGQSFMFLQRMKVNSSTDIFVLITPSATFNSGDDDRVLNIFFAGNSGDWCRTTNTVLTVSGVTTDAIDIDTGTWTIDAALPGSLTAKCVASAGGDYIEVLGIGSPLTGGTSYGLKINSHEQFKLKNVAEGHIVSLQLVEGTKVEAISFSIAVLAEDQVTVSAEVVDVHTITCTLPSPTTVDLAEMYAGGAYVTATHTLGTNSTSPYYWAVYGTGDGTDAGLYQPAVADPLRAAYLIPSIGSGGVVDLITSTEGFGLSISALADLTANPATNYDYTTAGVFGSILYGHSEARLIFSNTTSGTGGGNKDATVVLGARANTNAVVGSDYEEKLTYICGAYIGN